MVHSSHEPRSTSPYHAEADVRSALSPQNGRRGGSGGGGGGGRSSTPNPFESGEGVGGSPSGGHAYGSTSDSLPASSSSTLPPSSSSFFSAFLPNALSSMEFPSASDTATYLEAQAHQVRSSNLKKTLGWQELISLGVGCTIGAGIFVVTGVVAATKAGPALFLCYIVAGLACCLAGLCYSELAAMTPSAGSAYAYARASLGQTVGWMIGWDLTLEYAVSGASVAQGWSNHLTALLNLMGLSLPKSISSAPWALHEETGEVYATGTVLDLPAMLISLAITMLLVRGVKESTRFASIMVLLKVAVVLFVIVVGAFFVAVENYEPFMPYGFFGISFFGHTAVGQKGPDGSPVGVLSGAAIVFFAYIGFDTVTTQSEEAANPQRDIPIGIIGSLSISTLLYVGVSLVLCGMVPYVDIDLEAPLSDAFGAVGMPWAEFIIALGALFGITSVLLVTLMGQPRVLMAMARDGLLPESFFAAVHPKFGTPYKSTIMTGVLVSLISSLVPLSVLVELVSIGTLLAFTVVCISILILRKTAPNVPRPFKCPYVPYVPAAGAFVCIMLMLSLPSSNWVRLLAWLSIGMLIYIFYGHKNSLRVQAERQVARNDREAQMELPGQDLFPPENQGIIYDDAGHISIPPSFSSSPPSAYAGPRRPLDHARESLLDEEYDTGARSSPSHVASVHAEQESEDALEAAAQPDEEYVSPRRYNKKEAKRALLDASRQARASDQ